MVNARGITFLSTIRFVKETYGREAHDRILAALAPRHCGTFLGPLREASWKPLADLVAYAETGRNLLAPDDPAYYRKLGLFTGRVERQMGGFAPMVADPATAMRLAPVIWSSLFDAGRMEFVVKGEREGVARITGFKTSPELCETNRGAIEGLLGTERMAASVTQTACAAEDSPYCELRVVWSPSST